MASTFRGKFPEPGFLASPSRPSLGLLYKTTGVSRRIATSALVIFASSIAQHQQHFAPAYLTPTHTNHSAKMEDLNTGAESATHLCVLVHGVRPPPLPPTPPKTNPPAQQLWGNPTHMLSIAKTLRAVHPPSSLYILLTTSNAGMHTYDGIHTCGERVCHEIEQTLSLHPSLTKLSVVGYSLGGLVARYAIGLLHAQGTLDNLECKNFAAFASPFLGVRSPRGGWRGGMWNFLGSRTLAASGRQLFGEDGFEGTGRPLVEVLADGRGVFAKGLGRFGRRTVYANVVNDRTAEWYTTGVDRRDPWGEWLESGGEGVKFVEGYEDVVLEPVQPALLGGGSGGGRGGRRGWGRW